MSKNKDKNINTTNIKSVINSRFFNTNRKIQISIY